MVVKTVEAAQFADRLAACQRKSAACIEVYHPFYQVEISADLMRNIFGIISLAPKKAADKVMIDAVTGGAWHAGPLKLEEAEGDSLCLADTIISQEEAVVRACKYSSLNFIKRCHTIASICLLYTSPSPRDCS